MTVSATAKTRIFTVTTQGVASSTVVTISASYRGVTRTVNLTVTPAGMSSITLSPSTVVGGNGSSGTATLNGNAPPGGAVVTLTSTSTAAATVPASVSIAYNTKSATFAVTTLGVNANTSSSIQGTYLGVTKNRTLTVQKAALTSMSLNRPRWWAGAPRRERRA